MTSAKRALGALARALLRLQGTPKWGPALHPERSRLTPGARRVRAIAPFRRGDSASRDQIVAFADRICRDEAIRRQVRRSPQGRALQRHSVAESVSAVIADAHRLWGESGGGEGVVSGLPGIVEVRQAASARGGRRSWPSLGTKYESPARSDR